MLISKVCRVSINFGDSFAILLFLEVLICQNINDLIRYCAPNIKKYIVTLWKLIVYYLHSRITLTSNFSSDSIFPRDIIIAKFVPLVPLLVYISGRDTY